MTTSQTGAGDPYATARSDMRDTTKWLASIFAAIAAVVVAGTPFASIGAMDWGDSRLHVAAGSVFLALAALMLAIAKTFTLLRSDGIFASDFAFDPNTTPRTLEEKELRDAARQINKHRSDLLPPEYDTVQELVEARQSVDETLRKLEAEKPRDEAKIEKWRALLAPFDDPVTNVLYFAQYWRRYARIKRALPWLAVYAFAALVLLFVFAWAAKPPSAEPKPPPCVVCVGPDKPPVPVRAPECALPVTFVTGKADIRDAQMAKINCVREFMQANTGVGVLLLAHTDTVSSDLHNVPLALKRARAVRTALVEQGGVAHSRVFMAEFPEHSLPVVTNDERSEDRNRVVAFRFFELPR